MYKIDVDVEIEDKSEGTVAYTRQAFPLPEELSLQLITGLADVIAKPVFVGLSHVQQLYLEGPNTPRAWTSLKNQKVVEGIIPIFCRHTIPLFLHLHHEMCTMSPGGLIRITSLDYDIVASAFWSIVSNPITLVKTIELADLIIDTEKDGK